MAGNDQRDQQRKVIELIHEVINQDESLREKYQIGDKFRFVRDRLRALLSHLENHYKSTEVVAKKTTREAESDEIIVYVYLYNAHGINLRSWQNMLTPKVFYEYSVNRPIYAEKNYVEKLLRSKRNIVQHAYLTIAIKKDDLLQSGSTLKDILENPLVKVKEGALRFNRLLALTHNHQDYVLNDDGVLIRKE